MRTIYKYPIEITDEQTITMPECAEIIHVGLDPQGTPCIWAEVITERSLRPYDVIVAGTGHPLPAGARNNHVGSFVQGSFVWHVFV